MLDIIVVEDEDELSVVLDEKVFVYDWWGFMLDIGDCVCVYGLINVEVIDRIWVVDRAGEFGDVGVFIDCISFGGYNVL